MAMNILPISNLYSPVPNILYVLKINYFDSKLLQAPFTKNFNIPNDRSKSFEFSVIFDGNILYYILTISSVTLEKLFFFFYIIRSFYIYDHNIILL